MALLKFDEWEVDLKLDRFAKTSAAHRHVANLRVVLVIVLLYYDEGRRVNAAPRWFLGRFRKQWPEKRPFVTDETARFLCKGNRLLNVWINCSVFAVLFVGREARKAEHRQGHVTFSFGWQKVAVMDTAEPRHQIKPHCAIRLKVGDPVRMHLVSQVTCNHAVIIQLVGWVERSETHLPIRGKVMGFAKAQPILRAVVILRSRALARRLEGRPLALASTLRGSPKYAMLSHRGGEHLRMTAIRVAVTAFAIRNPAKSQRGRASKS
jgi:hypothetical protein